jgi:hypothetical protein
LLSIRAVEVFIQARAASVGAVDASFKDLRSWIWILEVLFFALSRLFRKVELLFDNRHHLLRALEML